MPSKLRPLAASIDTGYRFVANEATESDSDEPQEKIKRVAFLRLKKEVKYLNENQCAQCGTPASPGAKYCESCGAPLAAPAAQPRTGHVRSCARVSSTSFLRAARRTALSRRRHSVCRDPYRYHNYSHHRGYIVSPVQCACSHYEQRFRNGHSFTGQCCRRTCFARGLCSVLHVARGSLRTDCREDGR